MNLRPPLWIERIVPRHILSIPPYVPGKPIEELQRELGVGDAVKMASNENPLGPSPKAVLAMEDHVGRVHVYPESSAPELRKALADAHGISQDSVILGNGSDELMQLAAHVFITPGDEAVMGANTFSMYHIVTEAFGGRAVRVALHRHKLDLAAMRRAVTDRTRLIFVANPNSPTGTIVSRGEFQSFFDDLPREGILLVVDEAYGEYVEGLDCPEGLDYLGRGVALLVLRTFSKIYGLAGLRVGYGMAEPWLVELMNRVRPPFNVSSMAQRAARAALEDVEHVERSREMTRSGIRYLSQELSGMGLEVIPSQANFVAFCLEADARPVYERLLKHGVIVRHLGSFGMEKCIRVTVGTDGENRRFVSALKGVLREEVAT